MDQVRFAYQNGVSPFSADDQRPSRQRTRAKYIRALSKVHDWYKKGWFVPEPQAFVDGDCWLQFAMKTVAVLFFPDAAIGIAKDAIENAGAEGPYNLRYVAWPTFEGEQPKFQANGLGFMVKQQDSEAKRAVIRDFIRWMTSPRRWSSTSRTRLRCLHLSPQVARLRGLPGPRPMVRRPAGHPDRPRLGRPHDRLRLLLGQLHRHSRLRGTRVAGRVERSENSGGGRGRHLRLQSDRTRRGQLTHRSRGRSRRPAGRGTRITPHPAPRSHRLPAAQVSVAAWACSCWRSRRSCS